MNEAEGPFFRAGADGVLLADFRALADSGRYPSPPVLTALARSLVGSTGGPNRDSALFELCHLVAALDTFGGGAEGRWLFFLGADKVLARRLRSDVENRLAGGARRHVAGAVAVSLAPQGLTVAYPDGGFEVRYARMPLLIALYEFLLGMEGFACAEDMGRIFERLGAAGPTAGAVGEATNRLAALLRRYRRAHMTWARNDEKFDPIHRFLQGRAGENRETVIDDQAILDFWLLHSQGSEFRGYKTVFDTFVRYGRSLAAGWRSLNAERALAIGTDVEAGEVEPADDGADAGDGFAGFGEWRSPFEVFDGEELAALNFFKSSSERKPIELLMHYGPDALRLARAFLRLDSFGPVQAGITNDLQVKRGPASVKRRLGCADAESYAAKHQVYRRLRGHLGQLQKATLHALMGASRAPLAPPGGADALVRAALAGSDPPEAEAPAVAKALIEARRAFAGLTRKGFEPLDEADDPRLEAFRAAAGALVSMSGILERMLARMAAAEEAGRRDGGVGLAAWFEEDRRLFSGHFAHLYGGAR